MLASVLPAAAFAQATTGVGEDAVPVPARGSRIRIGGLWSNYDSRFAPTANGGSKKGGLFDGYARDNLGAADLPTLAPAETNIRALSGLGSAFQLSLGKLEARGDVSKSTTPFQIDYGITNRLSVSVLVPYVETTGNNRFTLNRGGAGATVGQNPATHGHELITCGERRGRYADCSFARFACGRDCAVWKCGRVGWWVYGDSRESNGGTSVTVAGGVVQNADKRVVRHEYGCGFSRCAHCNITRATGD